MKRPLVLAATGIVCAAAPTLFAQQFTYNAAALPAQNIWTNGVEIVDVDADGDRDILFANGSSYSSGGAQAQHLFLNNGSGTFVAAHAQLNVASFNAQMVIAEDVDNDGDRDLIYAPEGAYPATTMVPRLLINNGAGTFSDQSVTRLPALTMASFCVAAGDVDNDGDLDLAFTNGATFGGVASQCRLYLNNGSGFYTDATAANMPVDTYNAQDVTFLDWDNDFDVDILLSGKGGAGKQGRIYLNNGSGVFVVSNVINAVGTGNTYEIDNGDLDGDGDQDLAVQSISSFSEGWARQNTPASVTNSTFTGTNGGDDNEMLLLDYDNDGDYDVFVASLAGTEKVYRNDGAGVFVYASATVIQAQGDSSLDAGFGDLDSDGDYDYVTAQGESNFVDKVYRNNGPAKDTSNPLLLAQSLPGSLISGNADFRARVRDAWADDGHVSASLRLVYATNDGAGGTSNATAAINQGSGTFRAGVPTNAGTTAISYAWVGRDDVGNTTQFGGTAQTGAGANGWSSVGGGTVGQKGVPVMVGVGTNGPNTAGFLGLYSARPNSNAFLNIGLSAGAVPFFGGTLHPFPIVAQVVLATDSKGELGFPYVLPAGLTPGTPIHLQYIVQDAANSYGAALSNGVTLIAQ